MLGFDDPERYRGPHPSFGSTVGRYANRIAGARFPLDGHDVRLTANEGANHLHGGKIGFGRVAWRAERCETPDGPGVVFRYRSPDGEEGYPGTLDATVAYVLARDALRIGFTATTDRPTVANLSHHSYFNLKDGGRSSIGDHELWLAAERYTPLAPDQIPTGEVAPVAGTRFDFRAPRPIAGAYDQNFALDGAGELVLAARVFEPESGRVLEVETTAPGVQLYTGEILDGTLRGKQGIAYAKRTGLCLETQHWPDAPNRPHFPSATLRPGETYHHQVAYRFGVG